MSWKKCISSGFRNREAAMECTGASPTEQSVSLSESQ